MPKILIALLALLALPLQARDMEWTIAWYLCGSDLESRIGAASTDLREVLSAQLPDNVQVVVETGGSSSWALDGLDAGKNERILVNSNGSSDLGGVPRSNMGDPRTLASFMSFVRDKFPARKTALIIWDHGGGSVYGVAVDENFGRDSLSLSELRQALASVYGDAPSAPPLEVIGFDACLMASIDTARAVQGYAGHLVASQELEPGVGWQYEYFLNSLGKDPGMGGAQLGKTICDSYLKGCEEAGQEEGVTLSVTDLGKFGELWDTYIAMGFEAVEALDQDDNFYVKYARQAMGTQNYGNDSSNSSGMVDLGGLAKGLSASLPKYSPRLLKALDEAVAYRVQGPHTKSMGLSCFYPFNDDPGAVQVLYDGNFVTPLLLLNAVATDAMSTDQAESDLEHLYALLGNGPAGEGQQAAGAAPHPGPVAPPAPTA
nr:hypothetical protein [Succinivibrionaceae bacterium]